MTVSALKLRSRELDYPGATERFLDIFNSTDPDVKTISVWKREWKGDEATVTIQNKHDIYLQCKRLEIHPYFWQYVCSWIDDSFYDMNIGETVECSIRQYSVVFFFKEHEIMFKLAAGL